MAQKPEGVKIGKETNLLGVSGIIEEVRRK